MESLSLKEWFFHYKKNRDLMFRKIESITENAEGYLVKNKDGSEEAALIKEKIASFAELVKAYEKSKSMTIVVPNTKENIDLIVKDWKSICDYKMLTVLFVNTSSSRETKWLIKPYVHNQVADNSSLKLGLLSIAESVDFL